MDVSV